MPASCRHACSASSALSPSPVGRNAVGSARFVATATKGWADVPLRTRNTFTSYAVCSWPSKSNATWHSATSAAASTMCAVNVMRSHAIGAITFRSSTVGLLSQPVALGDDAHLALREGHRDACLLERVVHREPELAPRPDPFLEVARPGAELEVERAVAEAQEEHDGRGLEQHPGRPARHIGEQRDDAVWFGAVGDADVDVEPAHAVRQRPVRHLVGDQAGIRHDDLGTFPGAHRAGADADPLHLAGEGAKLDGVADLDRALEEEDQAGDEVVDDVLQPEADADAEGTGDDRDAREIEAERREAEEEADQQDDVVNQARESGGDAALELHAREDVLLEDHARGRGQDEGDPDDEPEDEEVSQRHVERSTAQARLEDLRHTLAGG